MDTSLDSRLLRRVLLVLAFVGCGQIAKAQDWEKELRIAGSDPSKLASLVQRMAESDGASPTRSEKLGTAWIQASLRFLRLAQEAGMDPDDPLLRASKSGIRAAVAKYGTSRNRADVASAEAHFIVDARRWREALPLVQAAIEAARDAGKVQPSLWLDLIAVQLELGDAAAALKSLREHEAEFWALSDDTRAADALTLAVQVYLTCGLLDLATRCLDELDARVHDLGEPQRLDAKILRVELAHAAQDFPSVLSGASELLAGPLSEESGDGGRVLLLRGLSESERARTTGDLEPARRDLQRAIALPHIGPVERHAAEVMLVELELRARNVEVARKHLENSRALLDARLADRGDFVSPEELAGFEAMCAHFALETRASLPELASQRERLSHAFEDMWKTFEAGPARAGGVGFLHYSVSRFVVSTSIRLELALRGEEAGVEAALSVVLRAQRAGNAARTAALGELDLARVRSALCTSETGIVLILPAMDRSHVFLLDAGHATHHACAPRDVLDADVRELIKQFTSPPISGGEARSAQLVAAAARQLALDLLPDPQARERISRWKGVSVVGAELLGNFPFEELILDGDRALGLDVAVTYVPSLPLGVWLAERARVREGTESGIDAVFVIDPRPGNDADPTGRALPTLDLRDEELVLLRAPFAPERSRVIEGTQAVRACLSSPDVRDAIMLVILAHGVYDLRHGERPVGLALSQDATSNGVMWIEDVEQLAVPALVLLYACGSARGPVRMGDDSATHLGGAFLRAGADAVLVSRGDVSLRATLAIASVMHERLARGEAPAEALRRARVALAADPELCAALRRSRSRIDGLGLRSVFASNDHMQASGTTAGFGSTRPWWIAAVIAAAACALFALRARRAR